MAELTDGTAELRVLVTTALGALPLENAIVSVSTAPDDTGMRTLLYSVTTDSGGMTPVHDTDNAAAQQLAEPGQRPAVRGLHGRNLRRGLHAAHRPAHRHVLRRADHAARGAHAARGKPELRADRPDRHRRAAGPRSRALPENP